MLIRKNTIKEGEHPNMENITSGDENTHWFHSNGIITSVNHIDKTIIVDIKEKNNLFNPGNITLNCSKDSVDISLLKTGQEIVFYFFKSNINDTTVSVEEISTITNQLYRNSLLSVTKQCRNC